MDRQKKGRPKVKNPRDKRLSIRVTENELKHIQEVADKYNLTYIEIFMKGLEHWEDSEK